MANTAQQIDIPVEEKGRKSVIADYCRERSEEKGYKECVLLCLRRGKRFYAMDIPIKPDEPTVGLDKLRRESGKWWKRYSLYSAIAVKEVNVRLMEVDRPAGGPPQIRVSVFNVDYADQILQVDRLIDIESDGIEPMECGIDINGESHEEGDGLECLNAAYNALDGTYCKANRVRMFSRRRLNLKWLPSMLEYYWQNGVSKGGLVFLRRVGFVLSYEELQYDTFDDAANPHGKSTPALLLVEGWHVRYLLILIGLGLSASMCVVAIVAALAQSLEIALTAGSYACGLAGCLIAVFTFLSAVL